MDKYNKIKTLVSSVVLLSSLALAGCGGGSDSAAKTPNGIYSGSIVGGDAARNGAEEKAVIYNGRLMVLSNNVDGVSQFFDANLTQVENILTGSGVRYDASGLSANDIAYSGSYLAEVSATIDFSETTVGTVPVTLSSGTINLTADKSLYAKASSLTLLTGTWSGIFVAGSNASMILNIGSDGVIAASSGDQGDGADCEFTGAFSLVDSSVNVYGVNLISSGGVGGCNLDAGSYAGLAWIEGDTNNTLVLMAADGDNGRAVVLTRN